jgi:hypothetical protein
MCHYGGRYGYLSAVDSFQLIFMLSTLASRPLLETLSGILSAEDVRCRIVLPDIVLR